MALLASMVPNTSTASGAVYTPPVGQQTTSPTNNVKASANTTPTPAPIDLSSSYGKSSNGTIYKLGANGQNTQAFSNPADFFASSGQKSFNNLKFSPYTPTGNETVYGSTPAALNFGTPPSSGSSASGGTSTGMLQTLAAKARDIVLAIHLNVALFRLYLPPYLYAARITGSQPPPLIVDNIQTLVKGVVISRHSIS